MDVPLLPRFLTTDTPVRRTDRKGILQAADWNMCQRQTSSENKTIALDQPAALSASGLWEATR